MSNAARQLNDYDFKYALLHHRLRVHELERRGKLTCFEHSLLRQSRDHIAAPRANTHSYARHFDPEYIVELDAFAVTHPSGGDRHGE